MPYILIEQRRLAYIALVVPPVITIYYPKLNLTIYYRLRRKRSRTILVRKDLKRLLRLLPVLTKWVVPE